ncbi:MAG: signal transduction histidine kinase LytS [Bacteroidetes bacterium]|nr:MAG: signal transduction histidine kinase LytS [Bacteroidota bacterium]
MYFKLGDYENAIDHFYKAIELTQQFSGGVPEGTLLLNVGNIYYQTGQINKALNLYQQALNAVSSEKDLRLSVHAMLNIGKMYEKLDQNDSARHYFEQSIAQSKKIDNQEPLTMSYNAFGKFLMKSADFDKAEVFLTDALKLAAANQLLNETAKASMNLGSIAFERARLSDARAFYMQSLVLNKQQNYLFQQMENLQGLSRVEEKDNNHVKALEYYKEYLLLNDSLFNIQKQEQITAIEGKLNLQLKEEELQNQALLIEQQNNVLRQGRERMVYLAVVGFLLIIIIVILFSRNRLKQSREKALLEQKQLETEYRLLRSQMNPHFLFNALNSIQAFISENNTMQAELYLSKFARLMRYYLESSSKSAITLLEEVDGLRLNIELERLRMNNAFDFSVDVDANINLEEIEIAPMLAQPFVENAIKHGLRTKKEHGFLELSYFLENNYIRCRIQDNGIGRLASGLRKTNETHESKGIELTRRRLMYLHGKSYKDEMLQVMDLFHENGEPAGTQIEFIFPYN